MPPVIDVPTAGHAISTAPNTLSTIGVGSCMVVCLYASAAKSGALLHFMLPRLGQDTSNPFRYGDTAISNTLKELVAKGISKNQVTAKVIGGAQMFANLGSAQSIGQKNTDETFRLLRILGIPVVSSDVGGNAGRNVEFDLNTGMVTITKPSVNQTLTL